MNLRRMRRLKPHSGVLSDEAQLHSACDSGFHIGDYIMERSPNGALSVRSDIFKSLKNLILFPYAGTQAKRSVRKLVTYNYRYLVYYRVDVVAEKIVILTIQHPARRRKYTDN